MKENKFDLKLVFPKKDGIIYIMFSTNRKHRLKKILHLPLHGITKKGIPTGKSAVGEVRTSPL
jgi:hypothetical protein